MDLPRSRRTRPLQTNGGLGEGGARRRRRRRRRRSGVDLDSAWEDSAAGKDPKEERALGLLIAFIVVIIIAICAVVVFQSLDWMAEPFSGI